MPLPMSIISAMSNERNDDRLVNYVKAKQHGATLGVSLNPAKI